MNSWCAISAAALLVTLGAGPAAGTEPTNPTKPVGNDPGVALLSLGRLGPLGTSNPLFAAILSGTEPSVLVGPAARSRGGKRSEGGDDSEARPRSNGNMLALAGGTATGLGLLIAALSDGSGAKFNAPNQPGDNGPPGGDPNPPTDNPNDNNGGNGGDEGGNQDGDEGGNPGGDEGGNAGGDEGGSQGGNESGDQGSGDPGNHDPVDPPPGNGGTGGEPVTVTPEPASMALLASGLAGLGGFQFRRHRKRIRSERGEE